MFVYAKALILTSRNENWDKLPTINFLKMVFVLRYDNSKVGSFVRLRQQCSSCCSSGHVCSLFFVDS